MMSDERTAVVVGAGDVGAAVLRHLAGSGEFHEVWALDIDAERARLAVHDAVAIASYTASEPSPRSAAADVLNVDELATTLSAISPSVIVQTATLQSWWVITQLPPDTWTRLEREARFGPWLPFHLAPAASVLAAAKSACPGVPVVNVAFPDAVNAVLAALGTPATTGAGNSELLRPGLHQAAAERLEVSAERVTLEWIGHHYHVVYYWMELEAVETLDPDSFHLRVRLDGRDVSSEIDVADVLATAGRRLPKGRAIGERTAASAAKNARLLLGPGSIDDHASSALGLAGGCDVRFVDGVVELRLPDRVDVSAAERILARAQLGDGIAEIGADGAVVFTDPSAAAMRDILGYDCPVLRPQDARERATELRDRLAALTTA
jgi:hypothetical protein